MTSYPGFCAQSYTVLEWPPRWNRCYNGCRVLRLEPLLPERASCVWCDVSVIQPGSATYCAAAARTDGGAASRRDADKTYQYQRYGAGCYQFVLLTVETCSRLGRPFMDLLHASRPSLWRPLGACARPRCACCPTLRIWPYHVATASSPRSTLSQASSGNSALAFARPMLAFSTASAAFL
jgi:hypothetical protein